MRVIVLLLIACAYAFDLEEMLEKESNKDCSKNGKNYRFGDEWKRDHMTYKCGKWGMYEITGCETARGRKMEKGEIHVDGNIVRACTEKGNSVGYKESICGIWGAPECTEIEGKWRKEQKSNGGITPLKQFEARPQQIKKDKQPSLSRQYNLSSKKNYPEKSNQPKVEWFNSPNGKVKSGKISYKSAVSWEPDVTQLRTVTIRDGKVVETPHSLDTTLTVPVHTVMRMDPNGRMGYMKKTGSH